MITVTGISVIRTVDDMPLATTNVSWFIRRGLRATFVAPTVTLTRTKVRYTYCRERETRFRAATVHGLFA